MLKIFFLGLLLFSCRSISWAQSASHFDGIDDKATVYHHSDFDLNKHNFTIEVTIRNVPIDKTIRTIISKRNSSTNGFALIINTKENIELIAEIGTKSYKIDATVLKEPGCHSIALRRMEEEVTLFIDDKAYSRGPNLTNINTKENLIIGADGANIHTPFKGYIEEIRFWEVARTNQNIFDWNQKCLPKNSYGLLAHWDINETSGQFFHDIALVQHHAYLGNSLNNDHQDPKWTSNKCIIECCGSNANFLTTTSTPLASQWVKFTNTSINAVSYEWSLDNQILSTNQHWQHSFGKGVFIIRLKATNENGCSAYHSEVIEVNNSNFSYCGEEKIASDAVQALEDFENTIPLPNPLPTLKMYDRFGNRYLPKEVTIPEPLESIGSTPNSCSCGIFELHFEDMIHNRDYGFDDPTLGADRRAVTCRVFEDLSLLVNPTGTLSSNLVQIQVKKSDGRAPLENTSVNKIDQGVLAVASPYIITSYNNGTIDGLVHKTIRSGTNAIANTPGWNPNSYHGSFRVDFELPNFFLNNTNWTNTTPINQTDLYSTILHESLHLLGFYSLIDVNTNSSKLNGSQLYNRFDTYLQNAAGTPYINSTTGILNPASAFLGTANCTADVKFNSTTNPNQDIYLPSSWNFSILSHFNCSVTNGQGCASNNGYIMNACLPPGEMQRAPNQQEFNTLCDIGYQLGTSYGNSAVGTPANNVPYQTYASCSSPCPVSGIDDDLRTTIVVPNGGTVTINASDFLTNDGNPGGSYNLTTLLTSFGTISNATTTEFSFTADPTFWGTAIIQYTPICLNGNSGSNALIFITVSPPPFPACNLSTSSCNLLCFGDFETITGDATGHTVGIFDDFKTTYENSGIPTFGSATVVATTELVRFNTTTQSPNWSMLNQNLYGCTGNFVANPPLPFPIGFPNKNSYIGMISLSSTIQNYDHIYLPLAAPLDISTTGTDNYRLTFWAFTPCIDVDFRMALSDAPPCINGVNNLYDPINAPYLPTSLSNCPLYFDGRNTTCSSYTPALNKGITINNPPDTTGAYSWKQYTLDFHVNTPNIQHVIFHPAFGSGFRPPGTPTSCYSKYILLDEMTIEKITQPQLTVTSTVVGTPCPGNKVVIEYDICSDVPVSGLDLEVQLPLGSGLLYANTQDFVNGQITGLNLGTGGNPLCTLLQIEIEIPIGASTPSTQAVFMDISGSSACTNTASNLTTDIDIVAGSTMSIAIIPSTAAPLTIGNSFFVDITIQNNGSYDVQNVIVDLLSGPLSAGLSHTFTPTNVGTILAGDQYTISNVQIDVLGPCGDAQVCAEVSSADGATCNLPDGCSPLLSILGVGTIGFPIETENPTHTNPALFTATAISNNDEIYSVGLFSNDIHFIEGANVDTLIKSHTCTSLLSPFLVKYSACGFEWAIEIPSCNLIDLKTGPDVEVGFNGDIYVSFSFIGSFIINGITYISQGGADIAIIKYDATGTPIWVKVEGGIGEDWVTDIETYYNGTNEEVFIIGSLFGSSSNAVTFTTIPNTVINYNNLGNFCFSCNAPGGITYIAAYIDNGASISTNWVNSLNNIATFSGKLAIDITGNVYAIGSTNTSFNFNGTVVGSTSTSLNDGMPSFSNNDIDIFVLKYSNNGNEIWAEVYGSRSIDIGYLEASSFEFDIECEGNTHLGILLPSTAQPLFSTTQPYMHNFGTHLLRINALDGSLSWVQPIATPTSSPNPNIIGNYTYRCNLSISNSSYLVNGSFLLGNPSAVSPLYFPSITFHGTTINYTAMSAYPTFDRYQGAFTLNFDNTGNLQWLNTNTSIIPLSPPSDIHSIFSNLDIETDNSGNIYAPFYLRGTTSLGSNNLTGGINGNQDVVDGFISKINPVTGAYLRPMTVNNSLDSDITLEPNSYNLLATNPIPNNTISTKLTPNPTTGKVILEITSSSQKNEIDQIEIYDITGRKVQAINNNNQNTFELNLNQQQSGIYILKMMINQEYITKRVILMK